MIYGEDFGRIISICLCKKTSFIYAKFVPMELDSLYLIPLVTYMIF